MHRQIRWLHLMCVVTALAGLSLLRPLAAPRAHVFGELVSYHQLPGLSGAT